MVLSFQLHRRHFLLQCRRARVVVRWWTWGDEGAVMASKEGGGRGRKANKKVRQGSWLLIVYISWKQCISLEFLFSTTRRSFWLRYYDVVSGARAGTVVVTKGGRGRNGVERGKRVSHNLSLGLVGWIARVSPSNLYWLKTKQFSKLSSVWSRHWK